MTILNGYQPAHVVRYFEEICAIPHPSHHEQALCAYIRGCAERYGHRYVEDAAGNLMVYLNATPGYAAGAYGHGFCQGTGLQP